MCLSLKAIVALSTSFVISSCTDSGGPAAPTGNSGPTRLISGPTTMNVVTRDTPLAATQSASATIGISGGQISLPGVGLTVIVPAFAVTSSTTITVTAVAGNAVAYEFAPHGLQFNVPVVVRQ